MQMRKLLAQQSKAAVFVFAWLIVTLAAHIFLEFVPQAAEPNAVPAAIEPIPATKPAPAIVPLYRARPKDLETA
jgi:hypothetical protein